MKQSRYFLVRWVGWKRPTYALVGGKLVRGAGANVGRQENVILIQSQTLYVKWLNKYGADFLGWAPWKKRLAGKGETGVAIRSWPGINCAAKCFVSLDKECSCEWVKSCPHVCSFNPSCPLNNITYTIVNDTIVRLKLMQLMLCWTSNWRNTVMGKFYIRCCQGLIQQHTTLQCGNLIRWQVHDTIPGLVSIVKKCNSKDANTHNWWARHPDVLIAKWQ